MEYKNLLQYDKYLGSCDIDAKSYQITRNALQGTLNQDMINKYLTKVQITAQKLKENLLGEEVVKYKIASEHAYYIENHISSKVSQIDFKLNKDRRIFPKNADRFYRKFTQNIMQDHNINVDNIRLSLSQILSFSNSYSNLVAKGFVSKEYDKNRLYEVTDKLIKFQDLFEVLLEDMGIFLTDTYKHSSISNLFKMKSILKQNEFISDKIKLRLDEINTIILILEDLELIGTDLFSKLDYENITINDLLNIHTGGILNIIETGYLDQEVVIHEHQEDDMKECRLSISNLNMLLDTYNCKHISSESDLNSALNMINKVRDDVWDMIQDFIDKYFQKHVGRYVYKKLSACKTDKIFDENLNIGEISYFAKRYAKDKKSFVSKLGKRFLGIDNLDFDDLESRYIRTISRLIRIKKKYGSKKV